jgi:pyridoxine 5-phosphate synthase
MTALSVNVNKLATLRNARGKNRPDVVAFARRILSYGADGLTVHPRPDGRHIRTGDVHALSALVREWNAKSGGAVEFNIEGFPSEDFLRLVEEVLPHQATLVPDPPEALTSNAGWDLENGLLGEVVPRLTASGVRVSLFVDPARFTPAQGEALTRLKPGRIELYTESYADHYPSGERDAALAPYKQTALYAQARGIGVNAGHDLDQANLGYLLEQIPGIAEVSIGHALICEALEQGLETTIGNYLAIIRKSHAADSHASRPQR